MDDYQNQYNTGIHRSLGVSPFEVFFGRPLNFDLALLQDLNPIEEDMLESDDTAVNFDEEEEGIGEPLDISVEDDVDEPADETIDLEPVNETVGNDVREQETTLCENEIAEPNTDAGDNELETNRKGNNVTTHTKFNSKVQDDTCTGVKFNFIPLFFLVLLQFQ